VRGGDVLVRVNVERAQVLRFVGRGPATLRHVAQGMAHELVATHDGYAPARLVLPANAEWDRVDGVARYEAALQLQALATGAAVEFGESQLPRDVGAPNGRDGELRVVTTPKGAKVYELVGFAPEARVDNLPIEEVNEFLIVRPGYAPALQVVSPSDFEAQAGRSVADVGVALVPIGTR